MTLLDCKERTRILTEELPKEKQNILRKFTLECNSDLYWERPKGRYPNQVYFSHKFVKRSSVLRIVFYIYRLCFAKVKYFESNLEDFIPCIYDWKKGLVECDLYDMEFLKHKHSETVFDLRNLAKITKIEDFVEICNYLEEMKKNKEGL